MTRQSQFVSRENSRVLEYARPVNNNPPKDLVDRKESDMSIGTQPEEEIMKMHRMIKASE